MAKTLLYSYSESNRDASELLNTTSAVSRFAQSFTGDGNPLYSVVFYMNKSLSPSGNVTATLYADSAGLPTGSSLTTSDAVDSTTIPTSLTLKEFFFTVPYTLVNSTTYWIAIEYGGPQTIGVGFDESSSSGTGRAASFGVSWSLFASTTDLCLYIYTGLPLAPTTIYRIQGFQ